MENKEKYEQVFIKSFALTKEALNENLIYESVPLGFYRSYGNDC